MSEKKTPVVRSAFSAPVRSLFVTSGKCRVDQSQREFTDINVIVKRAQRTGNWPFHPGGRQPFYADATQIGDLQNAFEVTKRAQEAFMALPADVRRQLDNDPRRLGDWLGDRKNWKAAEAAGLLTLPERPQEPAKAPQPEARTASSAAPSAPSPGAKKTE